MQFLRRKTVLGPTTNVNFYAPDPALHDSAAAPGSALQYR